jgi:hypothetical protein
MLLPPLKKKGKHFDPECLTCHVVGLKPWEAPENASATDRKFEGGTGFLSLQITPHLKNVQCENCHGPARAHLENSKINLRIRIQNDLREVVTRAAIHQHLILKHTGQK